MPLRALILNDTRRGSFNRHLGCNVVMENLLHLCATHGVEVVRTFNHPDPLNAPGFGDTLATVDAVIVNGEGTMHHDSRGALALSRAIIRAKQAGRKTALLNAVWQDNREVNACLAALDAVCVRDGLSLQQVRAAGATHAHVAPDFSLYRADELPQSPERAVRVAEADSSAIVIDSVDEAAALRLRRFATEHQLPFRVMQAWAVREADERHPLAHERFFFLADVEAPAVLITGRFHAVCFAIKHGHPFLALPSNTHKMEALLGDIGVPPEDFLLPDGWERKPASFWIEHAAAAWQRHSEQIAAFAGRASVAIEETFRNIVRKLGADPLARSLAQESASHRRQVRVCVFNPWAGQLENLADHFARSLPAAAAEQTVAGNARRESEISQNLLRCIAALRHDRMEFLPPWVCGPAGLIDFAKRPLAPGEDRWFISMAEEVPVLRAQAGKVFGLLVRVGVRHLVLAHGAADQDTPAIREVAPHIDVLMRIAGIDEGSIGVKVADAIATGG